MNHMPLQQHGSPLVSIITFCRNGAHTIRRCLESLLALRYENLEFVIQDGCSTDGTLEIIRSYAGQFGERLKLVSEPDLGPADAMFKALKRCKGEIIGSCLADEELLHYAVSWAVDRFNERADAGAVHGDMYNTDIDGNITAENHADNFDLVGYLSQEIASIHFVASFFRKAALEKVGLHTHKWDLEIGADYEIWIRLAPHYNIVHYPVILAKYAIHPGEVSEIPEQRMAYTAARARFLTHYLVDPATPEYVRAQRKTILLKYNAWAATCLLRCDRPDEARKYLAEFQRLQQESPTAVQPAKETVDELESLLQTLAVNENLSNVLLIGAGTSSSNIESLTNGLSHSTDAAHLFCIEPSQARFRELAGRFAGNDLVRPYNLSSVLPSAFAEEKEVELFYRYIPTTLNNYPLEQVLDWRNQDLNQFRQPGVDSDGIELIRRENGIERFDMVLIDGSEFTGKAELGKVYGARIVILNGINAFKNYANYKRLKEDPAYELIAENWHLRSGFAAFRKIDKDQHAADEAIESVAQPAAVINSAPAPAEKLKILLVYSLHPGPNSRVTLPEWIKECIRRDFTASVEVYACGPGNEIDIQDSADFYQQVAKVVDELDIDILWDIEGGAASMEFMFRRFPIGIKIPKVLWSVDTHQYLPLQAEKARYFDLVFSAQRNAIPHLGAKAEWMPLGASIHEVDHHLPRDITVGFIGNALQGVHDRRRRVLERLKREIPEFAFHSNVFLDEKARLASRMKIMINVSLNNDINFRVFETLACGAMLITDRIHGNGFEELFEEGKHLVVFDTEEDLLGKIRYYLSHEAERAAIATAGQERVLAAFTHTRILQHALPFLWRLDDENKNVRPRNLDKARCWCGGSLTASVHPLYGQCSLCGTQVLKEMLSEEQLRDFYTMSGYWHVYQNALANFPSIEQRSVQDFEDRIPVWHQLLTRYNPKPERLLEIGCAHGGFLSYCRERGAGQVVGVEVDEQTCAFARSRFNLPHVVSGLFPKVQLPFDKFNMITGFDVIEHFRDPIEGIQAVADHLTDDGMFIFQTPWYRGESSTWQQFKPEEHLFLYNERNVRELFARCGLSITEVQPGFFKDDMFIVGRKTTAVKRILFIRPDSIGDNVLAAAMLPHLKGKYPDAAITVVCRQHLAELYEACPEVAEVIGFDRDRAYDDDNYRNAVLQRLQAVKADLALNSVYSRELIGELLTIGAGAQTTIAFDGNLCNMTAEQVQTCNIHYSKILTADPAPKTEIERNREFLQAMGIDAPPLQPTVWLTDEDERFADEFFRSHKLEKEKTIALFAVGQWGQKVYDRYGEALGELCQDKDFTVIAFGAPGDREINDRILKSLGCRTINLAGETSLRQAAALLKRCRLGVGADTGTAHLACAVGIPNVVMLGGGHFGRFFPYSPLTSVVCLPLECYHCNWECRYARPHCIKDIDPQVMEAAVNATLDGTADKPRIFAAGKVFGQPQSGEPACRQLSNFIDPAAVSIVTVEKPATAAKVPLELVEQSGRQAARRKVAGKRG